MDISLSFKVSHNFNRTARDSMENVSKIRANLIEMVKPMRKLFENLTFVKILLFLVR